MSSVITEDIAAFLKTVPPFQFLEDVDRRKVSENLTLEFYPKDAVILKQDAPASDSLRIIKKGGVTISVRSESGEDVTIDHRGEGDTFGLISLIGQDRQKTTVVAIEDTICFLLGRDKILSLIETNPAFTEYFLQFHFSKYIDKTYTEMQGRSLLFGGGDKLLFTTPVGELATKTVQTGSPGMSIREAAEDMTRHGISSLVIIDADGAPVGIVTDRDLREKVVAKDRSVEDRVSNIMSVSLIKVDARDFCFDALLKMIHYNIHHLLVVDEGRLKGVVTNHDLMMLQGTSPLSLAREIESQPTIDGLVPASKKINKLIELLLKEGARSSNITRIITEINDRLVQRIIEIAEKKCGRPPLPYCWIVFGSEGRKEQTFKTDQDNALIYEDPATPAAAAAAEEYFKRFSEFVNESLIQCGFPPCPGNYMAKNPQWRQPISVWKDYFADWINRPTPEAILHSVILFDFRPLAGELSLGERLRTHLSAMVKDKGIFLKYLANLTISLRPPLGFFRTFVVEKSGEHKDELNLKFSILAPLIDIVRLFSLEQGVAETSTLERLDVLRQQGPLAAHADELEHSFEFITLLRVHHQYSQIETGREPDNFINPDKLTNLERKTLKEVCQLISRIQDSIAKQYNPGTVM
jgi:CBS domain-containing protein